MLISSVLPPASVIALAGITVSQTSMHPELAWLAIVLGQSGFDAELPYRQLMVKHPAGHGAFPQRMPDKFLRYSISCKSNGVIGFTSRFLAVL